MGDEKDLRNDRDRREYQKYFSRMLRGPTIVPFDFTDKETGVSIYIGYMLCRTQSMFRWTGLPDTIPQRDLELLLQCNGYAGVCPVDGDLYALCGGLGGMPDAYYRPTKLTIANPALKYNATLTIGTECALIRNDPLLMGLMPMASRYATQMTEVDLSMLLATINSRIINAITTPDDRTKDAAIAFLKQIADGKPGVMADTNFFESIKSLPFSGETGSRTLTDLIEMMQYIKASWYNDLGLNANYNMKRESLNSAESQLNNDALTPLVDLMLSSRREGAAEINRLYGTSISVDLASAWESNAREEDAELTALEEGAPDDGQTETE